MGDLVELEKIFRAFEMEGFLGSRVLLSKFSEVVPPSRMDLFYPV